MAAAYQHHLDSRTDYSIAMAEFIDLNLTRSGINGVLAYAFRPHATYGPLFYIGDGGAGLRVDSLTSGNYDWIVYGIGLNGSITTAASGTASAATSITFDSTTVGVVSALSIEVFPSGGSGGGGLTAGGSSVAFVRIDPNDSNDPLINGDSTFTDSLGASWSVLYTDPVISTPPVIFEQDGETAGDQFGYSVAMSGDGETVICGAPLFNSNQGKAYIYKLSPSGYTLSTSIVGATSAEQCGRSVAISKDGQRVAVASPQNSTTGTLRGMVRIFEFNGTSWNQKGSNIYGEADVELLGFDPPCLDMSEDGLTLIVSSYSYDSPSLTDIGKASVYYWNGSDWQKKGSSILGETQYDLVGFSVAISGDGDTIVVGAVGQDEGVTDSGNVKIYTWTGSSWKQKGQTLTGDFIYDNFGSCVDMDSGGNVIIVAASVSDEFSTNSGHAQVYAWNGTSWEERGDALGVSPSLIGASFVSLSSDGNVALMGSQVSNRIQSRAWDGNDWLTLNIIVGNNATGFSMSPSSRAEFVAYGQRAFNSNTGRLRISKIRHTSVPKLTVIDRPFIVPVIGELRLSNPPQLESYNSFSVSFVFRHTAVQSLSLTYLTRIVELFNPSGQGLKVEVDSSDSTATIITTHTDGTTTLQTSHDIFSLNHSWIAYIARYSPIEGLKVTVNSVELTDTGVLDLSESINSLRIIPRAGTSMDWPTDISGFNYFPRYLNDTEVALLKAQLSG